MYTDLSRLGTSIHKCSMQRTNFPIWLRLCQDTASKGARRSLSLGSGDVYDIERVEVGWLVSEL